MKEIKGNGQAINPIKEIYDLWYEIIFLRFMLNEFISIINLKVPGVCEYISKDLLDSCRMKAQEVMKLKFPLAGLEFRDESKSQ